MRQTRAPWRSAGIGLSWLLGACADPHYAAVPDGGADDAHVQGDTHGPDAHQPQGNDDAAADANLDATAPMTDVLPSWGVALLGRYASKTVAYTQDSFNTVTASTLVGLANFVRTDAGMQLRIKVCRSTATQPLADLVLVDPSNVPEHVEDVMFSETEQRWSTSGPTLTIGYSFEPPAACTGHTGDDVPHAAAQVWLSSSDCRCPLAGEDPLPDDCRVLDPDGDQHPGFTYQLTSTTGNRAYYVGSTYDSHYDNGVVDPMGQRHTANLGASEHFYLFGTDPANSPNFTSSARACPKSFNHAQFVRIADDAGCADVLASAAMLFADDAAGDTHCYQ